MNPVLYIIMRKDIQDMNPGKGIAQGSHATSLFENWKGRETIRDKETSDATLEWEQSANGFGTTVVLEATIDEMISVDNEQAYSGIVYDPTYPWKNWYGEMYTSYEPTSMWTFVWNDEMKGETLRSLVLHP